MKTLAYLFVLMLLLVSPAAAQGRLEWPDPTAAPGALNPDITQANIADNICKRPGWSTKSIRPPASLTTALKLEQMKALGFDVDNPLPMVKTKSGKGKRADLTACVPKSGNPACYEEDHLISLQLGGNPRDPKNLWPQPWYGTWNARVKDTLENKLNALVCSGDLTLAEAQQAIATDWIAAYQKYVGPMPKGSTEKP